MIEHRNDMHLIGRLSTSAIKERILPSGDVVTEWRVVVDRPPGVPPRRVDALECVTFDDDVRRTVVGWRPGDVVEVRGSVRRRFWRSPAAGVVASRYEVVVRAAALVAGEDAPRGDPDSIDHNQPDDRAGRPETGTALQATNENDASAGVFSRLRRSA